VTDDNDKSIKSQAVAWIAGQPFNNVLLIAILFCIGWGGYYLQTQNHSQALRLQKSRSDIG